MHKDCKQVKDIVNLWYETQMGCMKKCKERQFEFAEMMWGLYNNKTKIKEKQTMGRAIDQDNRLDNHEKRLKLIEDALEEIIQTRVHHVDLVEDVDTRAKGVEVKPDKEFRAPVTVKKRRKKAEATT